MSLFYYFCPGYPYCPTVSVIIVSVVTCNYWNCEFEPLSTNLKRRTGGVWCPSRGSRYVFISLIRQITRADRCHVSEWLSDRKASAAAQAVAAEERQSAWKISPTRGHINTLGGKWGPDGEGNPKTWRITGKALANLPDRRQEMYGGSPRLIHAHLLYLAIKANLLFVFIMTGQEDAPPPRPSLFPSLRHQCWQDSIPARKSNIKLLFVFGNRVTLSWEKFNCVRILCRSVNDRPRLSSVLLFWRFDLSPVSGSCWNQSKPEPRRARSCAIGGSKL